MTTRQTRGNEFVEAIISDEATYTPDVERRLEAIHGAAQALWHVAKEVDEPMDKQALMFIHEALREHVTALKAGLYRNPRPGASVFAIPCPASYRDRPGENEMNAA